jgi:hypothetical protein
VLGIVKKAGLVAMLSRAIDVAFENDGLHVVVRMRRGTPPRAAKAFWWQSISVPT